MTRGEDRGVRLPARGKIQTPEIIQSRGQITTATEEIHRATGIDIARRVRVTRNEIESRRRIEQLPMDRDGRRRRGEMLSECRLSPCLRHPPQSKPLTRNQSNRDVITARTSTDFFVEQSVVVDLLVGKKKLKDAKKNLLG